MKTGREYVEQDCGYGTPCWVWQRATDGKGYGARWVASEKRVRKAHIVAYLEHGGEIPAGMQIDHLCRNRACVNPAHMEPVTNRENTLRGAGTILTAEQVQEILDAPRYRGSRQDLARKYGVAPATITGVRGGYRKP